MASSIPPRGPIPGQPFPWPPAEDQTGQAANPPAGQDSQAPQLTPEQWVAQQQAYAAQQPGEAPSPYHMPAQSQQQMPPPADTGLSWPQQHAPSPYDGQHTDPQLQADAAVAYEQALQQQIAAAAQGQTPAQEPWPTSQDSQGFDLGSYAPPAGQGYEQPPEHAPGYLQQAGFPGSAAEGYGHQPADPTQALKDYAAAQGGLEPAMLEDPHHFDEFEMHGEAEQPRSRRGLIIVATLVGALGVGGGLAYAYNNFILNKGPTAKTPVVQAAKTPAKLAPKDPGGKPFRHAKKSFYERLGKQPPKDPAAARPAAKRTVTAPDAPRRVRTVMVRPDGSLAPPPPRVPVRPATAKAAKPAAAAPPAESVMPGVLIQGFPPPKAPAAPSQSAAPAKVVKPAPGPLRGSVAQPPKPPSLPKVKAAAPTTTPKVRVVTPAPPTAKRVVVPKRIAIAPATPKPPATRAAQPAKPAPPRAAAPTTAPRRAPVSSGGGAGYVAWVSSQRHRMNALAEFANLQQKHAVAMAGKQPEIQQIDLGEKGIWYRLRIGPPTSKTSANDLCRKLLAGGLKNCWVRSF